MGAQTERLNRYVFDTNVVISALVFQAGSLAWLRQAWRVPAVVPVVSRATLTELLKVLACPKFDLQAADIGQLLGDYLPFAETVRTVPPAAMCVKSDPDDQMFVDLAVASMADAIVSGDRHLLELDGTAGLRVIQPTELRASL